MAHWHEDNPYADRAVYVPIERLAECVAGGELRIAGGAVVARDSGVLLRHWALQGDRLDAYLLPNARGFSAGVRYGSEPEDYFSPEVRDEGLARSLVEAARAEAEVEFVPAPGSRTGP